MQPEFPGTPPAAIKRSGASFARGKSKQDYGTPPDFMRAVHKRFGKLTYDLAARPDNKKAELFLSPDLDSLTVEWHKLLSGIHWLNPPFDNISEWASKCSREARLGARILFLVPASVGANWFSDYVHNQAEVLFLNGRLQFVGAKDPYPKDCVLICYNIQHRGAHGYDVWRWK